MCGARRAVSSTLLRTCAIGRVVDGGGRVYGLDGLIVADASIMPTIPRANTNLSTVALAERLAESIGES